jgi:hypothetical protein
MVCCLLFNFVVSFDFECCSVAQLCVLLHALFQAAAYHLPTVSPSAFPTFVYWKFTWVSAPCPSLLLWCTYSTPPPLLLVSFQFFVYCSGFIFFIWGGQSAQEAVMVYPKGSWGNTMLCLVLTYWSAKCLPSRFGACVHPWWDIIIILVFNLLSFGLTRVWTQDLMLAKQELYHFSHNPSSFWFSCFWNTISCFCSGMASDHNPPTYASHVVVITSVCPTWLKWVLLKNLSRLASNCKPSDTYLLSSWVSRHMQPCLAFFNSLLFLVDMSTYL